MPKETTDTTPAEPGYVCTVLVTPTTIGGCICAAGAVITVNKKDAETLAAMDPPRVRIDGV